MFLKKKNLNSTYLDELGARYSLTRGINESLESFQERVYKATRNPVSSKREDIYESMGFVTPLREKVVAEISLKANTQSRIKISCSKIYVWKDKEEAPAIEMELKNYKFLEDLISDLSNHDDVFDVRLLDDYDAYLKCINLMPFDTDQNYKEFVTESNEVNTLPEQYIDEIIDFNGLFKRKESVFEQGNSISNTELYRYDDENQVLYKGSSQSESLTFNYRKFPIYLVWLPIKVSYLDDPDYDFLVLEKDNKNNPKFLSQEGAKVYNKLLKISNTYWGE